MEASQGAEVTALLRRRVKEAMEEAAVEAGSLIVVAVSGGPDSLALLNLLCHLRDELGLRLHGAHLDHGLRGQASREDAEFVSRAFAALEVPFTAEQADVAGFRKTRRLSPEEAARQVRYSFLARVATDRTADAVALGHTADDQAETVLLHILRGSGPTGLRGMRPVTSRRVDGRDVTLIRPLLAVSRRETARYCATLGLEPRQDESNLSPEFARNRVRHELLPLMAKFNPRVRDALNRLARTVGQDLSYIDGEVERLWERHARHEGGGVVVDRGALSRLHPSLQHHLWRRALREVKGDLEDVEQGHIDAMAELMTGPSGRSLNLPGGIRLSTTFDEAALVRAESNQYALRQLEGEYTIQVPGVTRIPGWSVTAALADRVRKGETDSGGGPWSEQVAYLSPEGVGGPIQVRARAPGDRFQPMGMSGSKKLQDFMVDCHIPRGWRDRVPLVVSPRGIAWVVGWRVAEWAKGSGADTSLLELRFSPSG